MTRFCINCKYVCSTNNSYFCYKKLKTGKISPVTGEELNRDLYGSNICSIQRQHTSECGPEGKFWEEKSSSQHLHTMIINWLKRLCFE